ncbi:acetyl-CoA carboxylase biotin carboxyl carrier protein subunit [Winogradskyella maritima]|uniref:Acetyl-CoA carboxylase biotin carboxyl carrier protein subunit n=1 Tax=Winogradskyella maritima TaxID=1517766 RepID=A0ABV8ACK4_9FLAO|nr:acetyl-CoA carboxylase biotin carboxyl carrier protein subunit [Winogradskyella maritima]
MYKAKVNDAMEFELNDDSKLDAVSSSNTEFHIIDNNESFNAKVISTDFKKRMYRIEVNGNLYDVALQNELDQRITEMGFEVGSSKQVSEIKAPMPGLILEITVSEGTEVKENDTLLILEAMKMENVIASPREGVIKSISVKQGEAVEKNSLLLEFES